MVLANFIFSLKSPLKGHCTLNAARCHQINSGFKFLSFLDIGDTNQQISVKIWTKNFQAAERKKNELIYIAVEQISFFISIIQFLS